MKDNSFNGRKKQSFAEKFKNPHTRKKGFSSGTGSLKDKFIISGSMPEDQNSKEDLKEHKKKKKTIEKSLSWRKNSTKYPENSRPGMSDKSIKQLEKNYRELLMVEGNIVALKKDAKLIYISSCFNNEGKTMAAISTAYAMAAYSGLDVLLIDGNFDAPRIHELFGTDPAPGFSELCSSSAKPENVVLPTIHKGLSIITAGESKLNIWFDNNNVQNHLTDLASHFDYIICDGSSVMVSSEVSRTARLFDALFLVVECGKTRWEVLQVAEEKIKKTGGPIIGIVFNKRKYYIPSFVYRLIAKK